MNIGELIEYINDKIDNINEKYPNLISDEQRNNYIKSNVNLSMNSNEMNNCIKKIDILYNEITKQQEQTSKLENKNIKVLKRINNNGFISALLLTFVTGIIGVVIATTMYFLSIK